MSVLRSASLIYFFYLFTDTPTPDIYTLSLHDALPISCPSHPRPSCGFALCTRSRPSVGTRPPPWPPRRRDRKSTRLNSSHVAISYAVFCLKKKNKRVEEWTSCFLTTTAPRVYWTRLWT